MRRIIERIVTVVTTTTWKISWEADPPQPQDEVDPNQGISQTTLPGPTTVKEKEVDVSVTKESIETNGE